VPRAEPWRLVVCLNVWNDLPALRCTLPTWYAAADAVVAVDGCYASAGCAEGPSTDGTLAFLATLSKVTILPAPDGAPWPDQITKRNAYLTAGQPGDLLLVVDADEQLEGLAVFDRHLALDVGWLTVRSPLYRRPYSQPRAFAWRPGLRYAGRHHWLYVGTRLLTTHQHGGPGWLHRPLGLTLDHQRHTSRPPARHAAQARHQRAQAASEGLHRCPAPTLVHRAEAGHEALRIVQVTTYDPGMVATRLHTALNVTTPHVAVLATDGRQNVFRGAGQYDVVRDRGLLQDAVATADVVHCHVNYEALDSLGVQPSGALVIHHHGTPYRKHPANANARDLVRGAVLRLVSNPELLQYGAALHLLPNPMPVAAYRALARALWHPGPRLRVAHSPSKPALKGTDAFRAACARTGVEAVVLTGLSHRAALAAKAVCDLTFDSFWLGLQCSGLEAAAMGQPVLAGDAAVWWAWQTHTGGAPAYTLVEDEAMLAAVLERLARDPAYFYQLRARAWRHVTRWHDEAAVARAYLDLLDDAVGWRARLRV
jgi:glycosyltransferase involved in cell wall biosynthesis